VCLFAQRDCPQCVLDQHYVALIAARSVWVTSQGHN